MALVSVDRYRELTGDTTTEAGIVTAQIADSTALIGEWLGRLLESEERTETVVVHRSGAAHPLGLPVTALGASMAPGVTVVDDGWSVRGLPTALTLAEDVVIEGYRSWVEPADGYFASLTYTGGYTEDTLPVTLAYAIAEAARWLGLRRAASVAQSVPVGATSVRLGDAAVTYAKPATGLPDASGLVAAAGLSTALRPFRHPDLA